MRKSIDATGNDIDTRASRATHGEGQGMGPPGKGRPWHDEIPPRMVKDNPEVGSFSQCNSCHRGAAEGVYNEHQVSIPGYGRWED